MDIKITVDNEIGFGILGKDIDGDFSIWIAAGVDPVAGIKLASILTEKGVEWANGIEAPVGKVYVDDRREFTETIYPDGTVTKTCPCPDSFIPVTSSN